MAVKRINAWLFALALAVLATGATGQTTNYKLSASEAIRLPKFCWKQFMGDKFSGPQFDIPRDTCGVWVNHYCGGLIDLSRANREIGNERRRREELLSAKENTLYTLRGIQPYPHCPIRAHVETTLTIIDRELNAFR